MNCIGAKAWDVASSAQPKTSLLSTAPSHSTSPPDQNAWQPMHSMCRKALSAEKPTSIAFDCKRKAQHTCTLCVYSRHNCNADIHQSPHPHVQRQRSSRRLRSKSHLSSAPLSLSALSRHAHAAHSSPVWRVVHSKDVCSPCSARCTNLRLL